MVNIDVSEVKNKIDNKEEIVIIDVRTTPEHLRGKIEGSINIPLDVFEKKIEEIISDKEEPVYLYCLSGSRSEVAAQIMDQLGYKNVFNIISGLLAWKNKGYALVNT